MFLYSIICLFNIYKATDVYLKTFQEFKLEKFFIYNETNINNSEFIFIVFTDKVSMFSLKNQNKLIMNKDIFKTKKFNLLHIIISHLYNFCKNSDKNIYVLCDDTRSSDKTYSTKIIQLIKNIELLGLHNLCRLKYDKFETSIEDIIVNCCFFDLITFPCKLNNKETKLTIDDFITSARDNYRCYKVFKHNLDNKLFNIALENLAVNDDNGINILYGKLESDFKNDERIKNLKEKKSKNYYPALKEFIEVFFNVKFHDTSMGVINHRKLTKLKFIVNNDIFFKFLLEKINNNFSLITFNKENLLNISYSVQNANIFAQMSIQHEVIDNNDNYKTKILKKIIQCNEDKISKGQEKVIFSPNQINLSKIVEKNLNYSQTSQGSYFKDEYQNFIKFMSSLKENELDMFCFLYFVNDKIFENNFVLKIFKSETILSYLIFKLVIHANIFDPYNLQEFDSITYDLNKKYYITNLPFTILEKKLEDLKGTNVYKYLVCYIYFKLNSDVTEKKLFLRNIKTITNTNVDLRDTLRNICDDFKDIINNKSKLEFLYKNSKMLLKKIHNNLTPYNITQRSRYDIRSIEKLKLDKFGDVIIKYDQKICIFA